MGAMRPEELELLAIAIIHGNRKERESALKSLNPAVPLSILIHLYHGYSGGFNPLKKIRNQGYACEYNPKDWNCIIPVDMGNFHYLHISK